MKMALLGEKLPYTMSPIIHHKIMESIGRPGDYGILERKAEELPELFQMLQDEKYLGINVTIPYKTRVMQYLDEIAPEAQRIGSVNTVHIQNGRLIGYNTDYFGFGYSLKKAGISPAGKKALVLGAGGAAKAVALFLKDAGADVTVVSRDTDKIKNGFMGFPICGYEGIDGDILVNTTPLGTSPDIEACAVTKDVLGRFDAAADIVYNPRKTKFLRLAEELRMPYADGLTMLVAQAVKSQEIWQQLPIKEALIDRVTEELA